MSHPCDDAFDQSWLDLVWPDTLGRNLAVAGALCAAFSDGEQKGYDDAAEGEGYSRSAPDWHPGCGREVPR